jgi:hypothetical protein
VRDCLHGSVGADMSVSQPDFWGHQGPVSGRGGPHFAELINQVRRVQEQVATAQRPAHVATTVASQLSDIADTLASHQGNPADAAAGARPDLPGRGHPFLPPHVIDTWTDTEVRAHITYTDYFVGGNSVAAGAHGVVFSDIMGRLSVGGGRPLSRAAYLHVNFRTATPVGRRLDVEATLDRIDGRKRFISGRLLNDGVVVAEAEGLFIEIQDVSIAPLLSSGG